jgi:glyoxylase-like metal-dependent hydrolase (beta-lactamase superfamily II)
MRILRRSGSPSRLLGRTAVTVLALWASASTAGEAPPERYEVYAVRFGTIPQFAVRNLVAGADQEAKLDLPVMVWVLKGHGRVVLVDAGFHAEKFVTGWKIQGFVTPAVALARLGIRPEQVTDVILSHIHWDHADGIDLFPEATVWIQREEYAYYTGEAWQEGRRGVGADADVVNKLVARNLAGRLRFVEGDARVILPGITCYTGGRHTFASQYVVAETSRGPVVVASDNVYLYRNLTSRAPIAQTLDAAANLGAQDRMRTLAAKSQVIVPGHDPEVFTRFKTIADGVVEIVGRQ